MSVKSPVRLTSTATSQLPEAYGSDDEIVIVSPSDSEPTCVTPEKAGRSPHPSAIGAVQLVAPAVTAQKRTYLTDAPIESAGSVAESANEVTDAAAVPSSTLVVHPDTESPPYVAP